MAYLVTGGTGFIGSYVVHELIKAGKEVVCLQRSGITPLFRQVIGEKNLEKAKIVQADISNTPQVLDIVRENKIDKIVHLSSVLGATSPISAETHPAYAVQVNAVGMSNLFEAMRAFGVKKMVWTSTGQIFGRIVDIYSGPMGDDNAFYMPDTFYAATKALCETMSRVYFDKLGVDSLNLRTGMILGIGKNQGKLTEFLRNAATGRPATMAAFDLNQVRSMGYIDNLTDLILKACEVPPTKTRNFNAVDYLVSCAQLAEAVRKVNPRASITLKEKCSREEQTWGGSSEPKLDISGLRRELNWQPKYSLEEALTRVFNQFRQQEGLPFL